MKNLSILANLLLGLGTANAATTAIVDFGNFLTDNRYGNQISGSSNNETISLRATDASTETGWSLTVEGLRSPGNNDTTFAENLWNDKTSFTEFSQSLGLSGVLDPVVWREITLCWPTAATPYLLWTTSSLIRNIRSVWVLAEKEEMEIPIFLLLKGPSLTAVG